MSVFEISILAALLFLIGLAFFLFLRDPILVLKGFLRFLKHGNGRMTIVSAPIWGPFWIIDQIFILGIFDETVEKTSKPFQIDITKYQNYLIINDNDLQEIKRVISKFHQSFDKKDYNYSISETEFSFIESRKETIVKMTGIISFETLKHLISFLSGNQNKELLYNPIGVFIDTSNLRNSFFLHKDWNDDFILLGRTFKRRRKIYSKLDIEENNQSVNKIFFNSNIENYKRFNFKKFIELIESSRFKKL